jgi:vitamin B12 transporter
MFSSIFNRIYLIAAFCVSASVQAQVVSSPEIFVTANRWGEVRQAVRADVHVLTREDIHRSGANSLPELLSLLPGIQSTTFGGSNVFVRGAESRMTALYIDGVRIESHDSMSMGGAPWDLLPLDMIERVEVIKGPMSALYGSDAMSGAIQIITKPSSQVDRQHVSVGIGTQGTHQATAGLRGGVEAFTYALRIGEKHSSGYNTRPDLTHTPNREGWTDRFASASLGWKIMPDHQLELITLGTDRDQRMAPYADGIDNRKQSNLQASSLKWRGQWSDAQSSQIQWTRGRNATKSDAPNPNDSPNDYFTVTETVTAQHQILLPLGQLKGLVERKSDKFDAMPTLYDPKVTGQRSQNALGLGYEFRQGSHNFRLNTRDDKYDAFGSKNTYSAGYAWDFERDWSLIASKSTGFRAPTLEQVFGPYGSSSLKPESATSREVAIERRSATFQWRATAYESQVTNLISSSQTLNICSAGYFCYYNVGQALMQGLSLSASTQLAGAKFDASYDYLDARDEIKHKQLSLRAKNQVRLSVSKMVEGVRLGAQLQAVGRRYDDAANTKELPGYAVVNVSLQKQLTSQWSFLISINNLTDKVYQQMGCTPGQCNFAAPGRSAFTSLTWTTKD